MPQHRRSNRKKFNKLKVPKIYFLKIYDRKSRTKIGRKCKEYANRTNTKHKYVYVNQLQWL